jgi:uncharacterized damage-inducible protein DinB
MATAVQYIKDNLGFVHRGFANAPGGLSTEQLNFVPVGESHSVAWTMWHAARIEDLFINQVFQGQRSEWEAGGWAAKTGLPEKGFGTGQSTADAKEVRIDNIEAFLEYAKEIARQADAFLDSLNDGDLEREVKLGERTETLGQSINLHMVTHLNGHRGEINTLRGMMGFAPVLVNQGG